MELGFLLWRRRLRCGGKEEAWDGVLLEEDLYGARRAGEERGVGGGKDGDGATPCGGDGGRDRRCSASGQVFEPKVGEDGAEKV